VKIESVAYMGNFEEQMRLLYYGVTCTVRQSRKRRVRRSDNAVSKANVEVALCVTQHRI
jgi:hypothetical protein